MAANLQATGRFIARRTTVNHISTGLAGREHPPAIKSHRRGLHVSTYDKNLDDQVRPATVPDDVIQLQSDNYWVPHPKTGVFGPADAGGCGGGHLSLQGNGSDRMLDQTAWFRPDEDVDKPTYS